MYRVRPGCRQEEENLTSITANSGTDLSTTTTKTVTTISEDQDDNATTIKEGKMISTIWSTASGSQKDDVGLDYEDIFGGEGSGRPDSSSAPTESIIVLPPTASPPSHCSPQRSVQQTPLT